MPTYRCPRCQIKLKLLKMYEHGLECCPLLFTTRNKFRKLCLVVDQDEEPKRGETQPTPKRQPAHGHYPAVCTLRVKHLGRHKKCNELDSSGQRRKNRKKCEAYVDPDHLFMLRCSINHDHFKDMSKQSDHVAAYLWCRRRTRKELGLISISVALDPYSTSLYRIATKCGVLSNTTTPHVTFAEGLLPEEIHWNVYMEQLKLLQKTLFFKKPSLTVRDVQAVPRRSDTNTSLIVANLHTESSHLVSAYERLSNVPGCIFPQFPLHVALGACSNEHVTVALQQISQELTGTLLYLDSRQLRVLPPPIEERFISTRPSQLQNTSSQYRVSDNLDRFPGISRGVAAADALNRSLASIPVFSWKRETTVPGRHAVMAEPVIQEATSKPHHTPSS